MIDLFSLGLTHALLLLAAWRLANRDDLDSDAPAPSAPPAPAAPVAPGRRWGRMPRA